MADTELETISIGGKEHQVDPALAAAIKGQAEELKQIKAAKDSQASRAVDELAAMIAEDKKKTSTQQVQTKKPEVIDYNDLMLTDPNAALAKFGDQLMTQVRGVVEEAVGGVRQEVQDTATKLSTANTEREFWSAFYEEHPGLKKHKMLVNAVMQRDEKQLAAIGDLPEVARHLADETKKTILSIQQSGNKGEKDPALTDASSSAPAPKSGKGEDGGKTAEGDQKKSTFSSVLQGMRRRTGYGGNGLRGQGEAQSSA